MCLSTTRLVLPMCSQGLPPVYLSTTRLTASVFIYNKACTANVLTLPTVCLSTTRLVLPVCKLGSLPVCLSTTRLIANVFICKKAFTSSVFFYNKACTANVLTRLTDSVYIYNKALLPVCFSTTMLVLTVC